MNIKTKNYKVQKSVDKAYDYINTLMDDDNLSENQEVIRVIFEIFDHSTGKYNIYMPSIVRQWTYEKKKVSEYEIDKFLSQYQYWNTSVSGAIFHFWKFGFFQKTKLTHLQLNIPRAFIKNIDALYKDLENSFQDLCRNHNFPNELAHEMESLFNINNKSLDNDFVAYTGLEEGIVHSTSIAGDRYYLFILPIIKNDIYLGLGYFSLPSQNLCQKVNIELNKINKLLEKYVFSDIIEDMISSAIDNENWSERFLQDRNIYNSVMELLNSAPIFPLAREKYKDEYTKYMTQYEFLCNGNNESEYSFYLWIPQRLINDNEFKELVKKFLESDYLKPVQKLEQDFREAEANAIVSSNNQKERAIAHIQKRLYAELSEFQRQAIYLFKSASKEPKYLRPMSLIIDYIGLTDLVRQFEFKKLSLESEENNQSLCSFLKGIYILSYTVLNSNTNKTIDARVYDYCSQILKSLKGNLEDVVSSDLFDVFNSAPRCDDINTLLKSIRCDSRIYINIPKAKSMLYILYGCFFEIFSNHFYHSHNKRKNICIFAYQYKNETGIIMSSCNCNSFNSFDNIQCQYEILSNILDSRMTPDEYYKKKSQEGKFIFKHIENQLEQQCTFYISDIEDIFSNIFVIRKDSKLFLINE